MPSRKRHQGTAGRPAARRRADHLHQQRHAPDGAEIDRIPVELDDALARTLDPEPSRRFTSAVELADTLARAGTAWLGGFRIDRVADAPGMKETRPDGATPTAATDEPATAVEGRN